VFHISYLKIVWPVIRRKIVEGRRMLYAGRKVAPLPARLLSLGEIKNVTSSCLNEKTAVRFLISNAGVDSQWDGLDLDPAVDWFALAPNEKVRSTDQSDYQQMVASPVKLGEVATPGQDVARHPPLNAPDNTAVFFAGIQSNTRGDYYQPDEPEMLFPGAVITFHLYDEALKQQHIYQAYATGQPVSAPQGQGYWPFTGIRNYQLRVREVALAPSGTKDGYQVVSDQLLYSGKLTFDMETGRINGLSLFLMGDFDNGRKLDIILDWHGDKG